MLKIIIIVFHRKNHIILKKKINKHKKFLQSTFKRIEFLENKLNVRSILKKILLRINLKVDLNNN